MKDMFIKQNQHLNSAYWYW